MKNCNGTRINPTPTKPTTNKPQEFLNDKVDDLLGEDCYSYGAFQADDNQFRFGFTPTELVSKRNKIVELLSQERELAKREVLEEVVKACDEEIEQSESISIATGIAIARTRVTAIQSLITKQEDK